MKKENNRVQQLFKTPVVVKTYQYFIKNIIVPDRKAHNKAFVCKIL
jgi:hypothetical protein